MADLTLGLQLVGSVAAPVLTGLSIVIAIHLGIRAIVDVEPRLVT